ncbi:MAG TPA: hypothetical protein VKR79_12050 [Gaiellaceae bacterium]|nr:hypothetical protein [Gaiellaceae bacterium]
MPVDLNPLWGCELMAVDLDLLRQRVELRFRKGMDHNTQLFRLTCEEVSDFRYTIGAETSGSGPWSWAEATAAEIVQLPDGRFRISFELWTESSEITIEAARASLELDQVVP